MSRPTAKDYSSVRDDHMLNVNRRGRGAETRQIVVPRSVQFQIDASRHLEPVKPLPQPAHDVKDGSTAWKQPNLTVYY